MKESLSNIQISENRHAISEPIVSLKQRHNQIEQISKVIKQQVTQLEKFIYIYLKLDLIIDELKQLTQRAMLYLVKIMLLVFFSPFSIAITSLGEERANPSAFRMFVRFVLVWICRFRLPLGVWEGLRFVIVALPGLFSYLFFLSVESSKCGPTLSDSFIS